ncbi:ABC transporter substrate-binding protein [Sporosarcina sp. FSL K6-1522]|uniref:efflux RND transporter periplasmic adaptor subunit n=1 Tax=Sporosarcina sp. FSL K6-1522 TaxID=2921554 RepID=UPI003159F8B4
MKKKVWIWVLSVVGVLAIATTVYFVTKGKSAGGFEEEFEGMGGVLAQKAAERDLGESILVTGKVVPEEEQKVFLEAENGDIHEYLVTENQVVSAGDPLFKYDVTKIDAEYNKAVRSRDLVQSRLKIEQNEIADIGKRLADMKKRVKNNDEVTQEDVNMLAKEKVQLEMGYEGTKDELTSAQEAINELMAQKKSMTVVSKINGIVVKVNKNVEKTETGSSEPVIHIISNEPFKVIGTMSEFDTVKIQAEQPVIVRPKVFKDREWNGVVESVSQFPEGEGGGDDFGGGGGNVTMYPFKVAITDDTSELRQGFHVSMEIKLGGAQVLAVPHMALMMDEEGLEYVYVLVENVLEKRVVQTGEMNDEFIGITEGIAVDELVIINPDESMHEGMEVDTFDEVE